METSQSSQSLEPKNIIFSVRVEAPQRLQHPLVSETVLVFKHSGSGLHNKEVAFVCPEQTISPGESGYKIWLCRRDTEDSEDSDDEKLWAMYESVNKSWGSKGSFSWRNTLISYSVDVVADVTNVDGTGHISFKDRSQVKFRIRMSFVKMHNTGVENCLKRDRKTLKRLRDSIKSKEDYYKDVLGYEDEVMRQANRDSIVMAGLLIKDSPAKKQQKIDLKQLEEQTKLAKEWKDNFHGLLLDVNDANLQAMDGWNEFADKDVMKKLVDVECSECSKKIEKGTEYECIQYPDCGGVFCGDCDKLDFCEYCDQQMCSSHLNDKKICNGCIEYQKSRQ